MVMRLLVRLRLVVLIVLLMLRVLLLGLVHGLLRLVLLVRLVWYRRATAREPLAVAGIGAVAVLRRTLLRLAIAATSAVPLLVRPTSHIADLHMYVF